MSMTFTKNAIDALNAASSCARQLGHDHIGAEHIFLSVLAIPKCQACQRLKRIGLSVEDLTESMRTMIAGNGGAVMQRGQLPLTARTKKVLDIACIEAGGPGKPINTVHLVTAMMREGENAAAQMLFNAGVTVEKFIADTSLKMEQLKFERSKVYNKIRGCKDPVKLAELVKQRDGMTAELARLRNKLKLAQRIIDDQPMLRGKVEAEKEQMREWYFPQRTLEQNKDRHRDDGAR